LVVVVAFHEQDNVHYLNPHLIDFPRQSRRRQVVVVVVSCPRRTPFSFRRHSVFHTPPTDGQKHCDIVLDPLLSFDGQDDVPRPTDDISFECRRPKRLATLPKFYKDHHLHSSCWRQVVVACKRPVKVPRRQLFSVAGPVLRNKCTMIGRHEQTQIPVSGDLDEVAFLAFHANLVSQNDQDPFSPSVGMFQFIIRIFKHLYGNYDYTSTG
jgi:hypothetical protein